MKKLTYSAMAIARLRANKKRYLSLILGIFLAIFLVTTVFLSAQGFLLAQVAKTESKVGTLDAFLLDYPAVSDETLMDLGIFTDIGHVYVTAKVDGSNTYIGYYDSSASEHMNRQLHSGRMPEKPGEIAVEYSTLLAMDLERQWQLGDAVDLSVKPIDGISVEKSYTLVGILTDQTALLEPRYQVNSAEAFADKFPAILVAPEEPSFETGRIAVHRTFLADGGKFAVPYCERIIDKFGYATVGNFFTISIVGNVTFDNGEFAHSIFYDERVAVPMMLGFLLAAALLISCCAGIAGAMDGALARRSEEIGLLRAVGATKRQIRRIFGRESLILAAFVAPVSMLLGIGAVAAIGYFVPEQMVLKLNPVLLVPIIFVSMGVILLSGYFPLRRYAERMPMSVIRDTAVLRKIKRVRSRKLFKAEKLIALRLIRLYPSRQISSGILAMLMLFSVACAAFAISMGMPVLQKETPAFEIQINNNHSNEYVTHLPNAPISAQSLAQIRKLPHVKNITIERRMDVHVLLEEKSRYLSRENICFNTQEEYEAQAEKNWGDQWKEEYRDSVISQYLESLRRYHEVRAQLNVQQEMVRLDLATIVLDEATLAQYSVLVESGKIDIKAINAGREVLVVAPKIWDGISEDGHSYTYYGPERTNKNEVLVAQNDCFYAGQSLPLIQLYSEEENAYAYEGIQASTQRRDATVTVGAVLKDCNTPVWSTVLILTTEEGVQNMGLYANGYDSYNIFLDGEIDRETEELLAQRLEAIASRSGDFHLYNRLESYREEVQTQKQLILVFAAITVLFTAVSVSMIVTSITRRIQSDGRRIGMLRAVGADEKMILGCYTGQVTASILGGFLAAAALLGAVILTDFVGGLIPYIPYGFGAMAGLGLLSWIACRYMLKLRIRSIVNKSIIDNIREL